MVSASHNPYADNGVKLFARRRPQARRPRRGAHRAPSCEASHGALARGDADAAPGRARSPLARPRGVDYVDHLARARARRRSRGRASWSTAATAPRTGSRRASFEQLGATVDVCNAEPDGENINAGCGSTHPEELQALVVERGADLGLAFDGDADRVIAVDEHGGSSTATR